MNTWEIIKRIVNSFQMSLNDDIIRRRKKSNLLHLLCERHTTRDEFLESVVDLLKSDMRWRFRIIANDHTPLKTVASLHCNYFGQYKFSGATMAKGHKILKHG